MEAKTNDEDVVDMSGVASGSDDEATTCRVRMTEVATPAQRVAYRTYLDTWAAAVKRARSAGILPDDDHVYARTAAVLTSAEGSIPSLIEYRRSVADACRTAELQAVQPVELGLAQQVDRQRRVAAARVPETAAEAGRRLIEYMNDKEGNSAAVLQHLFLTYATDIVGAVEPLRDGDAYPWLCRVRQY